MSEAASIFEEDYGQMVDLTARIREILRNYPEGSSVYKEGAYRILRARWGASPVLTSRPVGDHGTPALTFSDRAFALCPPATASHTECGRCQGSPRRSYARSAPARH